MSSKNCDNWESYCSSLPPVPGIKRGDFPTTKIVYSDELGAVDMAAGEKRDENVYGNVINIKIHIYTCTF